MTAQVLPLASYKLRVVDTHVRAVPLRAADGAAFDGPGVDLRGADARAAIAAARPLLAWLDAREPGVVVRSISVRVAGPRVLVSLAPAGADPRPRAVRFDPPWADEIRDAGREAERVIGEACARALARRAAPPTTG
ncbi:MAG: hypothetical protein KF764_22540 [Labilithrix sp.]|nr:hypothetical protein [Labilithrix sp.]MBX3223588.1 hypothetical protein [Labilithrix sp.]